MHGNYLLLKQQHNPGRNTIIKLHFIRKTYYEIILFQLITTSFSKSFFFFVTLHHTVKMNMLYLIHRIVATDYKQYYELNLTN